MEKDFVFRLREQERILGEMRDNVLGWMDDLLSDAFNPEAFLRYAAGLGIDLSQVPDLVGRKLDEVNLALVKNNLRIGRIVRHPDGSVPEGTVLAQTPEPGTKMNKLDKVDIRISVKPASKKLETVEQDSADGSEQG